MCREDEATAAGLSEHRKGEVYREVASAAESGWDFSSRWLADGHTLATIRTTQVSFGYLSNVCCVLCSVVV